MNNIRLFQTTPRTVIGVGAIQNIVEELRRLGGENITIVTDTGLVKAGIVEILEKLLDDAGFKFQRYDEIEPDPSLETAKKAARFVKEAGTDLVVGIGGGSALDIAKVAAVLAANNGALESYIGVDLIPARGLKTILVPTTAGTGSEVTHIAILSDHAEKLKKGIVSPHLFPDVAILDPALTQKLPGPVTASTGMDALIHAVEAYTSKNATPFSDMLAANAMKLIFSSLRTAYADGGNLEARGNMLEGSMLAGMAFANAGVTAVHAFAYPIGAEFHIPHGVSNCIMLLPVMEFNMIGNLSKFAKMAEFFEIDASVMSQRQAAMELIETWRLLADDLRIPTRLSEFGIKDEHIPDLAAGVLKVTRLLANNPRNVTQADAEAVYREVL